MNAQFNATIALRFAASKAAGMGTNKDTYTPSTVLVDWANGDGAAQVNHVWHTQRTVAGGGTFDILDLWGGLTNLWEEAIRFTKLKAIFFCNLDATPSNALWFGPSASNPVQNMFYGLLPQRIVRGGGFDLYVCSDADTDGYPVANGTADQMHVYNPNASAVSYVIALAGIT